MSRLSPGPQHEARGSEGIVRKDLSQALALVAMPEVLESIKKIHQVNQVFQKDSALIMFIPFILHNSHRHYTV